MVLMREVKLSDEITGHSSTLCREFEFVQDRGGKPATRKPQGAHRSDGFPQTSRPRRAALTLQRKVVRYVAAWPLCCAMISSTERFEFGKIPSGQLPMRFFTW